MNKILEFLAKHFVNSPQKMLFWTTLIAISTSAIAQIGAIAVNKDIEKKEKSYLLTQEFVDGCINIGAFLLFTPLLTKFGKILVSKGIITTANIKKTINEIAPELGKKMGKLSMNLDKHIGLEKFPLNEYQSLKTAAATVGTLTGTIISSNIIAPYGRNAAATAIQRNYMEQEENKKVIPQKPLQTYSTYTAPRYDMKI